MKRRTFLKTSVTASVLAGLGAPSFKAAAAEGGETSGREFYELRTYRFKAGADHKALDEYLEKAAIPALNRLGVKSVGVFTEQELRDNTPVVYVLIPHASPDAFASVTTRLPADAEYQKAAAGYLQTPKATPAFLRIDSWFLLAFTGMPRMELPAYCKEKKPRIFELRTYESYSEAKALSKVEMFNSGEIQAMREVGLGPIFYGQSLIGPDLPHLIYMTSAESQDLHRQHWSAFGQNAVWQKLRNDPKFADTVSKVTSRILVPLAFSQI